jgi:hypothetical protein
MSGRAGTIHANLPRKAATFLDQLANFARVVKALHTHIGAICMQKHRQKNTR